MDRILFKPTKFTQPGEIFETPSGLGGSFDIKFVKKDDAGFHFFRSERKDWPAESYTFSEEQLNTSVFRLVPDRFCRLMLTDAFRQKYDQLLADPHIDRVVPY